jgi:DNA-binding IclR family transcriptional regulator
VKARRRRTTAGDSARTSEPRYRNKAALNVLAALSSLADHRESIGATELATMLGMTKNMAHRILTTLERAGYLVRDASGKRFDIGPHVLRFGNTGEAEPDIQTLCHPYLQRLHAMSGESVYLAIIVGHSRVNIDGIEASGPRVSHLQKGRTVPLHATGTSRVLLACLGDEEIAHYVEQAAPFERRSDDHVADPDALWTEIRQIRDQGFSITQSTSLFNATYVAFPVVDSNGRPHAAIAVGGPRERFTLDRVSALLPNMRNVVAELNRRTAPIPASLVFVGGDR